MSWLKFWKKKTTSPPDTTAPAEVAPPIPNRPVPVQKESLAFDYIRFEHMLSVAVQEYMKRFLPKKDDVYAFSINYHPAFTTVIGMVGNTYSHLQETDPSDQWYLDYKYGEEEWEFGEWFDPLSAYLGECYDRWYQHYPAYDDPADEFDKHDQIYDNHARKIIRVCIDVLKKLKETEIYQEFNCPLLNVYVREYHSNEECIAIYEELNKDHHEEECAELVKFYQG